MKTKSIARQDKLLCSCHSSIQSHPNWDLLWLLLCNPEGHSSCVVTESCSGTPAARYNLTGHPCPCHSTPMSQSSYLGGFPPWTQKGQTSMNTERLGYPHGRWTGRWTSQLYYKENRTCCLPLQRSGRTCSTTPAGTWQWQMGPRPFHGSLLHGNALKLTTSTSTGKSETYNIYANTLSRWTRYCPSLMSALTRIKRPSPRQQGRRTKHLFDWMAQSHNLTKGSSQHTRLDRSLCVFCGLSETQCHINTSCTHPPLVEVRKLVRRQVDELLMSPRHQHLPPNQRWVLPLIDYMEDHLWTDSVTGGDLWNGRWTKDGI